MLISSIMLILYYNMSTSKKEMIIMVQATKKRIQVQVDSELAKEGDAVLDELGLTPTSAITMFYKRLVAEGGLPFSLQLTQREKDELAIRQLSEKRPLIALDTPEKIQKWMDEDE